MLLREKFDDDIFSFSERLIINYLLGNIENIEKMTLSSIANATHTNTTSIIRIAKKVNLSGWKDLKSELIQERNYLNANINHIDVNEPFNFADNPRSIANKIAVVMKESIDDSLNLIDFDKLIKICQLMFDKKKIMIFSAINNLNIVKNFVSNMRRIQYDVQISNLFDYPSFEAYNLSSDTVALFISYTGNNPEIVQLFKLVNRNNIQSVSITSMGENILSRDSTYYLKMSTQEKLYSKIATFNTSTSLIYLLNTIYSVLFSFEYDHNLNHIKTINHKLETRRINEPRLNESFENSEK